MPDLSFITINYNGLADTTELITSLVNVVHSVEWEIIVVDNASQADEASELARRFAADRRIVVVRSAANLGFAGGNNLGLRHARGAHLMLINNDTYVEDDHFAELLQFASAPEVGAVSPKIRFAAGERPIQYAGFTELTPVTLRNRGIGYGEPDRDQHDSPSPTAFAHGAALLFPRRTLEVGGWMTEDYFLYYEEMDWSLQLRRAGLEIWYTPVQTVFHKESQTTGQASPLRAFYMSRNRLLFARRNRRGIQRFLCYAYLVCVYVLRDVPTALLHRRPDLAAATLRGIVAFLNM